MFKEKEMEEKLQTYQKKLKNLKNKVRDLRDKNKELQNEKRKILKEKKEILDEHGNKLRNVITKMTDKDAGDLSKNSNELISRLEDEIFSLKEEIDELNKENQELIRDLNEYEDRDTFVVQTDGSTVVPSRSRIDGGIKCKSTLEIEDSVIVRGSVEATGDVKIGDQVKIDGSLKSKSGKIDIGARTEIRGKVRAPFIDIGEKSTAEVIECFGDVILAENTEVTDIIAVGNVQMKKGAKAQGSLKYGGDFDGAEGISIKESVMPLSKENIEEELKER